MSPVAAVAPAASSAMLPLAAVLAGAGIVSGIVGGISANSAAKTQSRAARAAQRQVEGYYNKATGYQQPYYDTGTRNMQTLDQQVAAGTYNMPTQDFQYNFQEDPGYQFRLQQGTNAVQNSAAAKGSGLSGATLKALQRYGQGFASNEYNTGYNRAYQNFSDAYNRQATEQNARYGRQAGMANIGVNASNMLSNLATNAGSQVADIMGQGANARAAGQMGVGNAIQSGIGGFTDYLTLSQLMNQGRQQTGNTTTTTIGGY
jgi:hypothetical protein